MFSTSVLDFFSFSSALNSKRSIPRKRCMDLLLTVILWCDLICKCMIAGIWKTRVLNWFLFHEGATWPICKLYPLPLFHEDDTFSSFQSTEWMLCSCMLICANYNKNSPFLCFVCLLFLILCQIGLSITCPDRPQERLHFAMKTRCGDLIVSPFFCFKR